MYNKANSNPDKIMNAFSLSDIDAVFCSHGHSDHVGALALVPSCLHLIGRDISKLNEYREVCVKPRFVEKILSFEK